MKNILLPLIACFLLLAAAPAFADNKEPPIAPTRESLVAAWEEKMLDDETVKAFEKTGEKGVYKFETGFFPYKGRLRLLNAVVTKSSESYPGLYSGIIEVELVDAPEDFFAKYAASYSAWTAQNYFYYDAQEAAGAAWFPASEWSAHVQAAGSANASSCPIRSYQNIFLLAAAVVFLGLLVAGIKKQSEKVWKSHATALEEQQRSIRISEESLTHQREHTRLLQEILAAVRK